MPLKKTDAVLLSDLKLLVAREREATAEILHALRDVEARKLHLERGFPSLFEFAVGELGYSAGAAHRRIAAMRLLKAVPELEPKIQSGELSLSTAARAQSFFREAGKTRKVSSREKRETVEQLLGLSTRECERKLAEISPVAALPKERERVVTEELTQIQFMADRELLGKLERLKGLLSHTNFEGSYAVLFDQLADLALKKLLPAPNEAAREKSREAKMKSTPLTSTPSQEKASDAASSPSGDSHETSPEPKTTDRNKRRSIPAAMKREVFRIHEGKCAFVDRKTGRRCESIHALEYDHRVPLALGGETTPENLRLLCSAHHRLETEKLARVV